MVYVGVLQNTSCPDRIHTWTLEAVHVGISGACNKSMYEKGWIKYIAALLRSNLDLVQITEYWAPLQFSERNTVLALDGYRLFFVIL